MNDSIPRWNRAAAEHWAAVRPPWWAQPTAPLLALAAAVAAAALGSAWSGPFLLGLAAVQAWWLWRLPELAAGGALLLGLLQFGLQAPQSWAVVVVAAAALWGFAASVRQLAVRREQEVVALAVVGERRWPVPLADITQGRGVFLLSLAGVGLVAAAVLAVLGIGEGTAGTLSAAVGLASTALVSRTRQRALLAAPAPAVSVLVRLGPNVREIVFPADDLEGRHPLFEVPTVAVDEFEDEEDFDDEDDLDEGGARTEPYAPGEAAKALADSNRLYEAVLYGTPRYGAEVVLVYTGPDDEEPTVSRSNGPVRAVGRETVNDPDGISAEVEADSLARTLRPRRTAQVWKGGRVARTMGPLILLLLAVTTWFAVVDGADGVWDWCWRLMIGAFWLVSGVRLASWQVTADRDGVRMDTGWRTVRIGWDELVRVRYDDDTLVLATREAEHRFNDIGLSLLERRLGLRTPARTAAAELNALRIAPALRPTEESGPLSGFPLGPVLVVGIGLVAVAALLLP